MKLAPILITLLVIGGFVTGMTTFYGALITHYSSDLNISSSMTMNTTNQTYEQVNSMMSKITAQNKTVESGSITADAPVNLLFATYDAIMLVLKTPTYFISIFSDLMSIGGIPYWVQTMIYGIITVIILFAIFEFISGRATE